ncbi:MAG TPA: LuxR family transcriptional regulator [Sphingomicrobium sp.]
MFERVEAFVRDVAGAASAEELSGLLDEISRDLGFGFFALTQHADPGAAPQPIIRLANYPAEWVDYFDAESLGLSDPVHRASGLTSVGFAWTELSRLIELTKRDRQILDMAAERGVGNGFTVPAHVPGEINGSCSFATCRGASFPGESLAAAQLVGAFAFEAARTIWKVRLAGRPARLTDRQRDCLLWVARGKSDWEISRILGVSHETVIQHLKQARERYGVGKRTQLTIRALFDGTLCFGDVLPP